MIPRRTPLKRSAPPKRGKRVRRANVARKRREFARVYGSADRVAFVQSLSCFACDAIGMESKWPVQNAHICGGGGSRKADRDKIIPLCAAHHTLMHMTGTRHFAERFSLDLLAGAHAVEAAWRCHLAQRGEE